MGIKEQVALVKESMTKYPNVKMVAAAKYVGVEQTKELIEAGITELGENRADSLLEKYEALKEFPISWHFFGTLQTRKVRDVVNKIDYLHSLDSLSLATEINKRSTKPLKCFVQVNVSEELNKSGLDLNKVKTFIKSLDKYPNIVVVGLMTIAKLTYDKELLAGYFKQMKKLQNEIIDLNLSYAPCTELSMGMSNDYLIALENGSTLVRLGRILLK
jgi:pyridoxal phosphate enzyme (YggS family)